MNKRLIAILFLFLLLFSMFPVQFGSSWLVGPGVTYTVFNGASPDEIYGFSSIIDLHNQSTGSNWIMFNGLGFNISLSTNVVHVNLSQIAYDPRSLGAETRVISFNITSNFLGSFTDIMLNGLISQHTYRLYNETGATNHYLKTNQTGQLRWNLTGGMFPVGGGTYSYKLYDYSGSPTITINYAGNFSELGGPYYKPPDEITALSGSWLNGYYTNSSYQHGGYVNINLTVSTAGAPIHSVFLHWFNQSGIPPNKWANATPFVQAGGYWNLNTSGSIVVHSGYWYSFDVWANDTNGNFRLVQWNKTDAEGDYNRRFIQLKRTQTNISYVPLYVYNATYSDTGMFDTLTHDQGTGMTGGDTGYLDRTTPTNAVQQVACAAGLDVVGCWFNNQTAILPINISNVYKHFWINTSSPGGGTTVYWDSKSRAWVTIPGGPLQPELDEVSTNRRNTITNVSCGTSIYGLISNRVGVTGGKRDFKSNNIYEYLFAVYGNEISVVSNRSLNSFVIFNVPDNATLNASFLNSDSDGLSDWNELYKNFTNPFLADTDNDGWNDYEEYNYSSDPNNYTSEPGSIAPVLTEEPLNGSIGVVLQPMCNVTIVCPSSKTNISFWDNTSGVWEKRQDNASISSGGTARWKYVGANVNLHTYYWKVFVNNTGSPSGIIEWTNETYYFRTIAVPGAIPVATTNDATGVLYTNSTLRGTLTNDGGENCYVGFDYGKTVSYNSTAHLTSTASWFNKTVVDKEGKLFSGGNTRYAYKFQNFEGSLQQISLYIRKYGSPTGSFYIRARYVLNDTICDQTTALNISNLSTSFDTITYYFTGHKYIYLNDIYVSVEYSGGDSSNYLGLGYQEAGTIKIYTYNGVWSLTANITMYIRLKLISEPFDFYTTGDTFSFNVEQLIPGTFYHFRARANNSVAISYGADKTFLTKPYAPSGFSIVRQGTGLNLSWTKGTGANKTIVRVSTTGYPATHTSGSSVYNGTSSTITNLSLTVGSTYYYRLWSYTIWGTSHSISGNYTEGNRTMMTTPVVLTNATTGTNATNATFHGYISSDGGENVTSYGFQYGETTAYGTTETESLKKYESVLYSGSQVDLYDEVWWGQTFRIGFNGMNTSFLLKRVSIVLNRQLNPNRVDVNVRNVTTTGLPGSVLYSTGFIPAANITAGVIGWYNISVEPVSLIRGETYCITVNCTTPGGFNYYRLYTKIAGYTAGTAVTSPDYGVTWSQSVGQDLSFRLYGISQGEFLNETTGLSPATFYHDRAFATNSNGTGYGTDRTFLTRPEAPTSLTVTPQLGSFKLEWENPTIGAGVNRSVYIRYKAGSVPTDRTDGVLLINRSSPLDADSELAPALLGAYGFAIWTYVNFSSLHMFSWMPATASGNLGGNYNITVYYENWTQGFVNLSKWGPHRIVFYTSNTTNEMYMQGYNTWGDLKLNLSCGSVRHQLTSGYIAVNLSMNPYQVEFEWNTTASSDSIETTQRFYGFSVNNVSLSSTTERFFGYSTKNMTEHTTTEYFTGYTKYQNATYTYIQLGHSPVNKSTTNVTCLNTTIPMSESYPSFILSGDVITIYPDAADEFNKINITYTYITGSGFSQNATTTIIQLVHTPTNKSATNVTCFNSGDSSKSYPAFILSDDIITIYPDMADEFTQINVTYYYTDSSGFSQNQTTTYIQLDHPPINIELVNVTCYNSIDNSKSYPTFLLNGDQIIINAGLADEFDQINVTYTYLHRYSNYRCNRMIVRTSDQYNMSFYIIVDKYLFDGFYVSGFNESLVKWVYNFIDNTGVFLNRPGIDTYAYIYTFSPNGSRLVIHSEYLDTYKKIYPMLLYGKKYFIGISCSVSTIDRIGFAPTETDSSRSTSVYVIIDIDNSLSFPEYTIKADYSAGATGLYVYYSDPFLSVVSSWLRVYDYNNGSLMYIGVSSASVKNYSYATALHNRSYTIYLMINSSNPNMNVIYNIYLFPGATARWSYNIINDTLTLIFGYTPFRSYENPSGKAIVPWVDVLVFVVFCLILFSIAGYNAALSGLASGGWFVFAGAMISGSPAIFITVGVVILLMSFLYAWGDRT